MTGTREQKPPSLPWEVFPSDNPTMIKGCRLEHEADMSDLMPVTGLGEGQSRKINAAHIVRACNSHDDLLAALKRTLPLLEDCIQTIDVVNTIIEVKAVIVRGESK